MSTQNGLLPTLHNDDVNGLKVKCVIPRYVWTALFHGVYFSGTLQNKPLPSAQKKKKKKKTSTSVILSKQSMPLAWDSGKMHFSSDNGFCSDRLVSETYFFFL